jgi:hypothetical protein
VTPAGQVGPVLALLVMTLFVRACVHAWMHPAYQKYRAERRAARKGRA